jgi:hypothetical protein
MDDDIEHVPPAPPILTHDDVYSWEREMGLHNRDNVVIRVKWVNALREIVSRTVPTNKVGTPMISDVDLLCATPEERAEAYRKVFGQAMRGSGARIT